MERNTYRPEGKRQRRWRLGRILGFCLRAFRNTAFVLWLVATLITISMSATAWAAYATYKAAQLTYRVGEMAVQHRQAMARAIARARLRRLVVAIPLVGAGAAVYFERQAYYEWLALYPDGTPEDYACDMAELTADVLDEVVQELPERVRPSERRLRNFVPDCTIT